MKKLFDLRFVIGAFFSIVGILLIAYAISSGKNTSQEVNRGCGIVFIAFGIIMISLSFRENKKDPG